MLGTLAATLKPSLRQPGRRFLANDLFLDFAQTLSRSICFQGTKSGLQSCLYNSYPSFKNTTAATVLMALPYSMPS